jgi:hypothetical protein
MIFRIGVVREEREGRIETVAGLRAAGLGEISEAARLYIFMPGRLPVRSSGSEAAKVTFFQGENKAFNLSWWIPGAPPHCWGRTAFRKPV